ncbi:hypothetical protein [Amycolatopsis cihanbeyliensis]|uniref:Uncharacterized protein n=1 Tax=Amycolatopsis cihanbeyliensis TaxID=1128664 RepID=A0A542DFQ5_AMYCI|nr:hypothetical protein [Amycolatopsis cihanbeyliensis]TQJ01899.1 hypothetical protein FB471_1615 [Amycolatopsis cihanbeyliensis]
MLYVVLILVLAALGGVVTALITADSLWAWISIGLSVLAGVLLLVDLLRRRSKAQQPVDAKETDGEEADGETERPAGDSAESAESVQSAETAVVDERPEQTALLPAAGELSGGGTDDTATEDSGTEDSRAEDSRAEDTANLEEPQAAKDAGDGEPGVEETDAADALVVSELDVEVVVVDEHPRYHLSGCGWLGERDTIPIELAEARELGFTPCARCTPDTTLAAAHRE